MARKDEDFYIKFGSNAKEWAAGLPTDLQKADDAIRATKGVLDSLDQAAAQIESRVSGRLQSLIALAEQTSSKLTSLPTDAVGSGGGAQLGAALTKDLQEYHSSLAGLFEGIKTFDTALGKMTTAVKELTGPLGKARRSQIQREAQLNPEKPPRAPQYKYPSGTIQGQIDAKTGQPVRAIAQSTFTRQGVTVQKGQPLPDGWKIGGRPATKGDVGAVLAPMVKQVDKAFRGVASEAENVGKKAKKAARDIEQAGNEVKKKTSMRDVPQATISAAAFDRVRKSIDQGSKRVEKAVKELGDKLGRAEVVATKKNKKSSDVDFEVTGKGKVLSLSEKQIQKLIDERTEATPKGKGKGKGDKTAQAVNELDAVDKMLADRIAAINKRSKAKAAKVQTSVATVEVEAQQAAAATAASVRKALRKVAGVSKELAEQIERDATAVPLDRDVKRKLSSGKKNAALLQAAQEAGGDEKRQEVYSALVSNAGGQTSKRATRLAQKILELTNEIDKDQHALANLRGEIAKGTLSGKELAAAETEVARREKGLAKLEQQRADKLRTYTNSESRIQEAQQRRAAANAEARSLRERDPISEAEKARIDQIRSDLQTGSMGREALMAKRYSRMDELKPEVARSVVVGGAKLPERRGEGALTAKEIRRILLTFANEGYRNAIPAHGETKDQLFERLVNVGQEFRESGGATATDLRTGKVNKELRVAETLQKVINAGTHLAKEFQKRPNLAATSASMSSGGESPFEFRGRKGRLQVGSAIADGDNVGLDFNREDVEKEREAFEAWHKKARQAAVKDVKQALRYDPSFNPEEFDPKDEFLVSGPKEKTKPATATVRLIRGAQKYIDGYAKQLHEEFVALNHLQDKMSELSRKAIDQNLSKKDRKNASRELGKVERDYEKALAQFNDTGDQLKRNLGMAPMYVLSPEFQEGVAGRDQMRQLREAHSMNRAFDAQRASQDRQIMKSAAFSTLLGGRIFTDKYGNSRDAMTRLFPGFRVAGKGGDLARYAGEYEAAGRSTPQGKQVEQRLTRALRGYTSSLSKLQKAVDDGVTDEAELNKLREKTRSKLESALSVYSQSLPGKGRPLLHSTEFLPESLGFDQHESERMIKIREKNEKDVLEQQKIANLSHRPTPDEVMGPQTVRVAETKKKLATAETKLAAASDKATAATAAREKAEKRIRESLDRADRKALESAEATRDSAQGEISALRASKPRDTFDTALDPKTTKIGQGYRRELEEMLGNDYHQSRANIQKRNLEEAQAAGYSGKDAKARANKATNDFFNEYARLQQRLAETTGRKARSALQKEIDKMRGQLSSTLRDDKGTFKDSRLRDYAGRDVFTYRMAENADFGGGFHSEVKKVGQSRASREYGKIEEQIVEVKRREAAAARQIESIMGDRAGAERKVEREANALRLAAAQEVQVQKQILALRQRTLIEERRTRADRKLSVTTALLAKAEAAVKANPTQENEKELRLAKGRQIKAAQERNRVNGRRAYTDDDGKYHEAIAGMSNDELLTELLTKYKGKKVKDFERQRGPEELKAERDQLRRQGNYTGTDVARLDEEYKKKQKAAAKAKGDQAKLTANEEVRVAKQELEAAKARKSRLAQIKQQLEAIDQSVLSESEQAAAQAKRASGRKPGKLESNLSKEDFSKYQKLGTEREQLKSQGGASGLATLEKAEAAAKKARSTAKGAVTRAEKKGDEAAIKAAKATLETADAELKAAKDAAAVVRARAERLREIRSEINKLKVKAGVDVAGGDGGDSGSGKSGGGKGGSGDAGKGAGKGGNYTGILQQILTAVRSVNTTLKSGLKVTGDMKLAAGSAGTARVTQPRVTKTPEEKLKTAEEWVTKRQKELDDLKPTLGNPKAKAQVTAAEEKLAAATKKEAEARDKLTKLEERRARLLAARQKAEELRAQSDHANERTPEAKARIEALEQRQRALMNWLPEHGGENTAQNPEAVRDELREVRNRLAGEKLDSENYNEPDPDKRGAAHFQAQQADALILDAQRDYRSRGGDKGIKRLQKEAADAAALVKKLEGEVAAATSTQKLTTAEAKKLATAEKRLATALKYRENAQNAVKTAEEKAAQTAAQANAPKAGRRGSTLDFSTPESRQAFAHTEHVKDIVPDLLRRAKAEGEVAKAVKLATEGGKRANEGVLTQAQAIEFFTKKLKLTGDAAKKFGADVNAGVNKVKIDRQVEAGAEASAKRAEREAAKKQSRDRQGEQQSKRTARATLESSLAQVKEARALAMVSEAVKKEATDLAKLHAAEGDSAKTAEMMISIYGRLAKELGQAGASTHTIGTVAKTVLNTAGQQSQSQFGGKGFSVNQQTVSQIAQVAQQTATQANSTVEGVFNRVLFGSHGFVNRVIASTGTFIVRNFSAGLVFGLTNALQQVIGEAIAAEQTFIRVSHALEQTGRDVGNLRGDLQNVAAEYGQDLNDTYDTAAGLVGLFDNNVDVEYGVKLVAQLQLISDGALNAKEALGVLASTSTAFGQQLNERFGNDTEAKLGHIADALVTIQNEMGTNIETTSEGVSRFAGLANQLGMSFEEASVYVAQVAKLTNQTGDGAGEQLSRIMQSLGTGRSRGALAKAFGTDVIAALNEGNYSQVLKIMGQGWSGLTKSQQNNLSITIAGQRQAASFAALMHDSTKALNTIKKATDEKGAADERAGKLLDTLQNSMKRFNTQLQNLAFNAIESGLLHPFIGLLKVTNLLLGKVNELWQGFNKMTDTGVVHWIKLITGGLIGLSVASALVRRSVSGFGAAFRQIATQAPKGPVSAFTQGAAVPAAPLVARPAFNSYAAAGSRVEGSLAARSAMFLGNRFVQRPLQYVGMGLGLVGQDPTAARPVSGWAQQRLDQLRSAPGVATFRSVAQVRGLEAMTGRLGTTADATARGLGRVGSAMGSLSRSGLMLDAAMMAITYSIIKLIEESRRQKSLGEAGDTAADNMFGFNAGKSDAEKDRGRYAGVASEAMAQDWKDGGPSTWAMGLKWLKNDLTFQFGDQAKDLRGMQGLNADGSYYGTQQNAEAWIQAMTGMKRDDKGKFQDVGVGLSEITDPEQLRAAGEQVLGKDGIFAKQAEKLKKDLEDGKINEAKYNTAMAGIEQNVQGVGDFIATRMAELQDIARLTADQVKNIQSMVQTVSDLGGGNGSALGVDLTPFLQEMYKNTGVNAAGKPKVDRLVQSLEKGGMDSVQMALKNNRLLRVEVDALQNEYLAYINSDPEKAAEILPDLQSAISQLGQSGRTLIDAIKQQADDIADAALGQNDVEGAVRAYDKAIKRILAARERRLDRLRGKRDDNVDLHDTLLESEGGSIGAYVRKTAPSNPVTSKEEKQRERQESRDIRDTMQKRIQARIDELNRHYDRLIAKAAGAAARAALEAERNQAIVGIWQDALGGQNAEYVDRRGAKDAKTKAIQADHDNAVAAAENNVAGMVLQAAGIWNEAAAQAAQEAIALQQWNDAKTNFGVGSTEALSAHQAYKAQLKAGTELDDQRAAAAEQAAIAAIPQGDAVGLSRAQLTAAQNAVARAKKYGKNSTTYQNALAQLYAAQQQVTAATNSVAVAQAQLAQAYADARGDAVAAARAGVAVARATLAAALDASGGVRSAEVLAAQAQLISANAGVDQAQADLVQAKVNIAIAIATAGGHTVQAAALQLKAARLALEAARKKSGGELTAEVAQAKASVIQAQAAARDARLQDDLDTIDFNLQMGKITQASAIHALEEILKTRNLTKEQRRQLMLQIKGMKDEMADSQWNFGDIKLPTPYQMRRYIESRKQNLRDMVDSTVRHSDGRRPRDVQADAMRSGGIGGGTQTTIENHDTKIYVNGADIAQVKKIIREVVGGNVNVKTSQGRRR